MEIELFLARATPRTTIENSYTARPLITDDELKDYGLEFIDVCKRASREELLPSFILMNKEIDSLKQEIDFLKKVVAHLLAK